MTADQREPRHKDANVAADIMSRSGLPLIWSSHGAETDIRVLCACHSRPDQHTRVNPLTQNCCHTGTAVMHPVRDRSFVIFEIRAL